MRALMLNIGLLLALGTTAFVQFRSCLALRERLALLTPQYDFLRARLEKLGPVGAGVPDAKELEALRGRSERMAEMKHVLERLEAEAQLARRDAAIPEEAPWIPLETLEARGRDTPRAALESVLLASFRGDLKALEGALIFKDRLAVKALLDGLPAADRADCGTPEAFVSLMTANSIKQQNVQFLEERIGESQTSASWRLRLQEPNGSDREITLNLYRAPDGWRLIVPPEAVSAYLERIRDGRK